MLAHGVSRWREPWEQSERCQPRNGAKEGILPYGTCLGAFSFAPFRGWTI
jgi:hypothetical protein